MSQSLTILTFEMCQYEPLDVLDLQLAGECLFVYEYTLNISIKYTKCSYERIGNVHT